ncbi:hypothetical protein ACFVTE_09855 [Arthrobacter sp. NPDC058097]|uniref:hypothetical protein n=1 Tax=Arthrobacter sp. NPDC058097 TaxID=3346340 RepID=UPI0036DD7D69
MRNMRKAGATIALTGSLLLTGGALAGPAVAANQAQDGLVNVAIGDVSVLNNANIGVAANVVAQVCGLKVGPVAVLARQVDRSGDAVTVCRAPSGPVVISQNQ